MGAYDIFNQPIKGRVGTRLYFEGDGVHVVMLNRVIDKCEMGKPRLFIHETTVLESTNPLYTPGTQVSYCESSKFPETMNKNIRSLVAAATGSRIEEVDGKAIESIYSEQQPLSTFQNGHAVIVRLQSVKQKKRTDGKFPYLNWRTLADTELPKYEDVARKLGLIGAPMATKKVASR
jgi:hypothetical protein